MSEGLAQSLYVVARVGFEPATLHTKGIEPHHWATTALHYTWTHIPNSFDELISEHTIFSTMGTYVWHVSLQVQTNHAKVIDSIIVIFIKKSFNGHTVTQNQI